MNWVTAVVLVNYWAKGDSTRTYRRLGPPIISIVLLYHLRRFYAVVHIKHQTCAQAQTNIPPACVHVMKTLNQSAPYGTLLIQAEYMTKNIQSMSISNQYCLCSKTQILISTPQVAELNRSNRNGIADTNMGDQECSRIISPCKTRNKNSRLRFNKSSQK